ncbi:TetR/AcrR family transcriptional regulator [Kaistella palustris]|uniref:TetR/AcrR family transcriptional regulator n=1 Tax=Kaistella palustris TaxID=493376 RepID=UPI0004187036|nr:TetR/AcrR family transcriptional regulator [Kaistella palustris]
MISKEENILFNAEILFAQKGFDGTSIRDISKKAQVNVSMISYYFGSKEKLFEKIFEYRMNESLSFSKEIIANEGMNEWEKINVIVSRYIERVRTLKMFYLIMQREQLRNRNKKILFLISDSKKGFLEIYSKLLESGLRNKVFTRKPRIEFLHSTISGTLFTALNTLPIYKDALDRDATYEQTYFEELNIHMTTILKHLLGYEENN